VEKSSIAKSLLSDMGSADTVTPEYQVGAGCLADQLVGQYMADVCGLGPLLDAKNIRTALASIYRYNSRAELSEHSSVQRIYALNDEAGLLICDYGKAERPRIPFPYYAEVWTGFEYMAGAQLIYAGMLREGTESFDNARRRFDGERRNPWDEAECGHHYARAMSAWSGVLASSGFHYYGPGRRVRMRPRSRAAAFRSFWSAGTGWGSFERTLEPRRTTLSVLAGSLAVGSLELPGPAASAVVALDGKAIGSSVASAAGVATVTLAEPLTLGEGARLSVDLRG
jgi:hypothetical protein